MSTITKQWLQQAISDHESVRDELPFGLDDYQGKILAALHIALASREAEPVHQVLTGDAWVDLSKGAMESQKRVGAIVRTLYTAPPAPVSVPDVPFDENSPYDVPCSMPSNLRELIAEEIGILFSDDGAQSVWDVCRRAAMLQGDKQ